jgi:hypothetical protein
MALKKNFTKTSGAAAQGPEEMETIKARRLMGEASRRSPQWGQMT